MFKINPLLAIFLLTYLTVQISGDPSKQIRNGVSKFANAFYEIVAKENKEANFLISPFNTHLALSILYQSSGGATEQKLASVLHLPNKTEAAVQYKHVLKSIIESENNSTYLANKIFLRDSLKLNPEFVSVLEDVYKSEIQLLNFSNVDASANEINGWVQNKTNHIVQQIINPDAITETLVMMLASTLYFKDSWGFKFDAANTKKEKFHQSEKVIVDCDMMFSYEVFGYYESKELDAKVLALPYSNDKTKMIIFLPRNSTGFDYLEQKLSTINLTNVLDKLDSSMVAVQIPKFQLEQFIDLRSVLEKMGLELLFTSEADFTGLIANSTLSPFIEKAVQKNYIKVNEEGTEAVSVDAFLLDIRIGPTVIPDPFRADRPFVFMLCSYENSKYNPDILFMGRVMKP